MIVDRPMRGSDRLEWEMRTLVIGAGPTTMHEHLPVLAKLRDSGEIVGVAPVGVSATDSLAELLALDARCVTYVPSVSGRDPDEVVNQICAILATGKNVITADPRMTFPPSLDEASRAKLRSACDEGDSTFLATGIAPGFATDVLPVHLASLTEQPKKIAVVGLTEQQVKESGRDYRTGKFPFSANGRARSNRKVGARSLSC